MASHTCSILLPRRDRDVGRQCNANPEWNRRSLRGHLTAVTEAVQSQQHPPPTPGGFSRFRVRRPEGAQAEPACPSPVVRARPFSGGSRMPKPPYETLGPGRVLTPGTQLRSSGRCTRRGVSTQRRSTCSAPWCQFATRRFMNQGFRRAMTRYSDINRLRRP